MKNQTQEPTPLTLADIVCRWYVGAVIGFAVGTTVSWIFQKCRKKS